jgi:peroxiredoxin
LKDFEARGATVVAISVDPPVRALMLAKKLKVEFPVLSDPSRDVIRGYGVDDADNEIAWPAIFIVDPMGVVRWRSLAETYPVRPAADVVLDALKQ